VEINHLKYFYATAKEKGFSRAAASLRISQSAVSRFVIQLEGELGGALFERGAREVRLTKLGADLFRHCEIIFSEFEQIKRNTNKKPALVEGKVNLGAAEGVAAFLLPAAVSRVSKLYPNIYLWIATGLASDLCSKVQAKAIEMAWLFHVPELSPGLEIRRTFAIPYTLVVATSHAKDRNVLSSFIGSREVDNTAVTHYPTLKRLQQDHPEARIKISTNSFSAHKELVIRGQGVAILPHFMVASELKSKKLKELYPKEEFVFQLKLVARLNHVFSSQAQAVIDQVVGVIGDLA